MEKAILFSVCENYVTWVNKLEKKIVKEIESNFKKEMEELGYLTANKNL